MDTLGYILGATGLGDDFDTLIADLREASEYRNLLAHAAIGPRLGKEDALLISAMRFRRGRRQSTVISTEEIAANVERLNALPPTVIELTKALGALPRGDAGAPSF